MPADSVGVSVRDVGKAERLMSRGVRVRAGDFTDPTALDYAFEDADQVLVVSAGIRGPAAAEANRAAIGAAVRAGASRVLYTDISIEGDLDVRGFFGFDEQTRAGFGGVRVAVRVSGPEAPHRYAELQAAVDAHCPVLDLFTNTTPVRTTLTVA